MTARAIAAFGLLAWLSRLPAWAEDPLDFTLAGRVQEWMGSSGGRVVEKGIDQLFITGKRALDDDISVEAVANFKDRQGILVSRSLDDSTSKLGRAYIALKSSDFGTLEAGQQANAGYVMHNSAPTLSMIGGQGQAWSSWVTAPPRYHGSLRSFDGDDGLSDKLLYISPQLAGFTAGVSYTPDINQRRSVAALPGSNSVGIDTDGLTRLRGDLWSEALSYGWSSGPQSARADVGLAEESGGRLLVGQAGLQIGYAGWLLGASVLRRAAQPDDVVFRQAADDGFAWDAGISYSIAGLSAAISLFREASLVLAPGGRAGQAANRDQAGSAELAYTLRRGLSVNATLLRVRYADGFGDAADQARGWTGIAGVSVAF